MADLDDLKKKRDQLIARIQKAEALQRVNTKKADDRIKVLVGAAVLEQIQRTGPDKMPALLKLLDSFLIRPTERTAVLGEDGQGSESFKRLTDYKPAVTNYPRKEEG
jgi:outer membrane scaffolding protein for murein synthesis (MipA/OmpV family)